MDEKILVTLPEHIANYLEYMKSFKYSIIGALNMTTSKYVSDGVVRGWLDDLINDFLKENPDIKLIDIKYQSNISAVADGGVSGTYYNNSALIIYREKENNG